jgi:hypothetical protein
VDDGRIPANPGGSTQAPETDHIAEAIPHASPGLGYEARSIPVPAFVQRPFRR